MHVHICIFTCINNYPLGDGSVSPPGLFKLTSLNNPWGGGGGGGGRVSNKVFTVVCYISVTIVLQVLMRKSNV